MGGLSWPSNHLHMVLAPACEQEILSPSEEPLEAPTNVCKLGYRHRMVTAPPGSPDTSRGPVSALAAAGRGRKKSMEKECGVCRLLRSSELQTLLELGMVYQ